MYENGYIIILSNVSDYCIGPFSTRDIAEAYADRHIRGSYEIRVMVLND